MESTNQNNTTETQSCKSGVSGWAYFRKHKTPILVGFAIGTTLSIILNLIENIVVKIALIIYGG
jgi:hypothetical protein